MTRRDFAARSYVIVIKLLPRAQRTEYVRIIQRICALSREFLSAVDESKLDARD